MRKPLDIDPENIRQLAEQFPSQTEIARCLNISITALRNHAARAKIILPLGKRGRPTTNPLSGGNLADYQRNFDAKHGENAHKRFLKLAKRMSLEDIAKAFGHADRQWASQFYKALTLGKRKQYAARRQTRPDVTTKQISLLAQQYNISQIARILETSPSTVTRRASAHHIRLIDGRSLFRKCPALTRKKIIKLRKNGWLFREIAEKFSVHIVTVFRRKALIKN